MRLTNQKRALALLLSLAALLSLTVLPAQASRFQDVEDQRVSLAADTLSSLGVVSGTGEGEFSPDGHLTRAQLCKMAVEVMGLGEQAKAQAYRTIFTDMGGDHWARGYVNLAAITQVPAESGTRLMLGLGDGTFGPDREVTYQEAATLTLRILGYGEEANRAWPYSAIETAAQLGLDQDLGIENPAAPITRAQTALLFYHMLTAPTKGEGKPYASTLGGAVENAILLASDATVNGRSGWAVVAEGEGTQSYPAAGPVDQSLLGKRGWAILDKQGRFVTLVPDESSCVTAPVQRKQAYYLYLNGQRYALSEDTRVYTGSVHDAGVTVYKDYAANITTGTMVTLYLDEQGKVAALYRAEASVESSFMVVGTKAPSYATFRALTGSEEDYTIRRNGVTISVGAIKQYDVVTYDPVSKVLDVCDVRLSCIYENAYPSLNSPSRITAAGGNQFDVMADAIGDFAGKKLGDSITLLFTSSGKVAGVLPKEASSSVFASSSALGMVSGDSFQLLGCNLTLKLTGSAPMTDVLGDVFNASSTKRGELTLTPAGNRVNMKFDTAEMTLAGMKVSPSVRIYERTDSGLVARSLSELPFTVTAVQYHKDSTGPVDLIILAPYSGDGVDYGRIDVLTGYQLVQVSGGTGGEEAAPRWVLQTNEQLVFTGKDGRRTYPVGSIHYTRGYGTVTERNGYASVSYLQSITKVPSSAFYTQGDITYVRTNRGVYQVDDDVQCFNGAASFGGNGTPPLWVTWMQANGGSWVGELPPGASGEESWYPDDPNVVQFSSLGECRNFSSTVTIYIDSVGQRVRVVEAGG